MGTRQVTEIVRRYTTELEESSTDESDDLSAALIERRKKEEKLRQLRKHFGSSSLSDLDALKRQSDELRQTWSKFQDSIPPEPRIHVSSKSIRKDDVLRAVETARKQWDVKQSRGQRTRAHTGPIKHFHSFSSTLDAHSIPMQILPKSAQYTSLFHGCLCTLIQTAVSYQKTAEYLVLSLCEINDAVASIDKKVWACPTPPLQELVARLYTQIFLFQAETMNWYTRKARHRLLRSYNANIREDLDINITEIRRLTKVINQEAERGSAIELHCPKTDTQMFCDDVKMYLQAEGQTRVEMRELLEDMRANALRIMEAEQKKFLDQNKSLLLDRLAEWTKTVEQNVELAVQKEMLGSPALKMISGMAEKYVLDSPGAPLSPGLSIRSRQATPEPDNVQHTAPTPHHLTTRTSAQSHSTHLEPYFLPSSILPDSLSIDPNPRSDPQVLTTLQQWTLSQDSKSQYIMFSTKTLSTQDSVSLAAHYTTMLHDLHIPVVSFFCDLDDEAFLAGRAEEKALIGLVYALIRQLINLLPQVIEERANVKNTLEVSRLGVLDGTLGSVESGIGLLGDLLDMVRQPLLFCVVEGLQWVEDAEGRLGRYVERIVDVLSEHVRRANARGSTFKVLYATSGRCGALLERLDTEEIMMVTSNLDNGRPSPGRKSLGSLRFF